MEARHAEVGVFIEPGAGRGGGERKRKRRKRKRRGGEKWMEQDEENGRGK